jgi:serpin B
MEPGQLSFAQTPNADAAERLISAVSLWAERSLQLKPAFLEDVRAMGAELTPVDLGDPSACAAMNEWVHARTGGQINRLIDPGEIPAGTVLLILTVFYFKGRWAQPFDPAQTRDGFFKLADGTDQRAPKMHRIGTFSYGGLAGCDAVELPFASGRVGMRVLLPAKAPPDENEMMEALLQRPHFPERLGEIAIPRLRIDLNVDLVEALTAAGVEAIFSPEAEFGRMSNDRICVGRVKQRATVTLDEEGTEAAAVASIQFIRSFTPLGFKFIVDRPFYWTIYHTQTNLLLLVGFVANPKDT